LRGHALRSTHFLFPLAKNRIERARNNAQIFEYLLNGIEIGG
jgi:hypothetical protein